MSRTLYYSASGGQLPKLTGLTFDRIIVDEMATIDKKIKWVSAEGRMRLAARAEIRPRGWEVGLTEAEMDAVHQWCQTNNCGKRTSFDTFQFKNKKEMTMFLLRWGS